MDTRGRPARYRNLAEGMARWRRIAWLVILVADAGLLAWGAAAALLPERLPGPGSAPILQPATKASPGAPGSELAATSPKTAGYITLVFRMYGIYIVAFGLLAIAIAATAYRRDDRWAWWTLLSATPSPLSRQ